MASDNLEDKVTKEKDEEDDSLPVVSEPRSVELAENERQDTLVLLNANVTLNWDYGSKSSRITVPIS